MKEIIVSNSLFLIAIIILSDDYHYAQYGETDMDDYIFDFVYSMAMTDATKRTDSATFIESLLENTDAKGMVKEHLRNILNNESEDVITVIENVANSLHNNENSFSFGNAQKLVNMTVKYFYIMVYNNRTDRSLFEEAHCPMDRIMKDIVVKKYKDAIENDIEQKNRRIEYYSKADGSETKDWSSVAWSKIDNQNRELYCKFQVMVLYLCRIDEEEIHPIDYDYKYYKTG